MQTTNPKQYFTDFLKRNNCRVTPERFKVLDAVLKHRGHFEADELFMEMRKRGVRVSRATVYSTLETLTGSGMIARYRFGEKFARYELVFGVEPHHHIVCRSCGKIEEFADRRIERLARDAASTMGYALDDHVMYIYGLCAACQ